MGSMWKIFKNTMASLLRYLWHYSGTLAMLSLMLGVLGMGLYHLIVKDVGLSYKEARFSRLYTGLYNSAGPQPPAGIGALAAPGETGCIQFFYNDAGLPERVVCVGADGAVCPLPCSNVAEQSVTYDAQGRVVAKYNKDAEGNPAADAHGVASREFSYDEHGNLVREVARDASGKKVVPRMPGYAEKRVSYDAKHRPTEVKYTNGKGRPICNAEGENNVRYHYNDAQNLTTRSNFENGVLRDNVYGVAVEKTHASEDGLLKRSRRYSANGEVVPHAKDGAAVVLVEQSPSTRTKRVRRLDQAGNGVRQARICAEHLLRTDAQGKPEWECYNDADGAPCDNPELGYAEHVWEYNDSGELTREFFWNAAGQPAPCYEKRYGGQGVGRHVLSLHTDGSTVLKSCD